MVTVSTFDRKDYRMKDRYDLEMEVLKLHPIRNQLETVADRVREGSIDSDDLADILMGLASLVDVHCESIHGAMEEVLNCAVSSHD